MLSTCGLKAAVMEIMEGRGYGPLERIESCASFRRGEGSLLSTAWSKKVAGDRSSTCRSSARWKESTSGLEKGRCHWRRLGIALCEGVGALSQRNWMEGKRSTGIARGGELTTMAAVLSVLGACARGNGAEEVERGRAVHKGEGEV